LLFEVDENHPLEPTLAPLLVNLLGSHHQKHQFEVLAELWVEVTDLFLPRQLDIVDDS
jgi:hypothetical protein